VRRAGASSGVRPAISFRLASTRAELTEKQRHGEVFVAAWMRFCVRAALTEGPSELKTRSSLCGSVTLWLFL
jgi:hypothetical protein